ncbi:hypothetical protein KIW84_024261 [Lathyrus oleraceus]|uniref:Uncharacterized protein n=1 Tax=Pisum sativum TaxID=3888 RepID=A0A9D4YL22_PEA|nr:hypothetical protein KIW84_024261 [Pisum sativum]
MASSSRNPLVVGRVIGDILDPFESSIPLQITYGNRNVFNGCELDRISLRRDIVGVTDYARSTMEEHHGTSVESSATTARFCSFETLQQTRRYKTNFADAL